MADHEEISRGLSEGLEHWEIAVHEGSDPSVVSGRLHVTVADRATVLIGLTGKLWRFVAGRSGSKSIACRGCRGMCGIGCRVAGHRRR